jgi:DNA-binding transcriptional MerR regulator
MYTVKEAAQKLNLSPHTVRYYTDMGMVPSLSRNENNNRLFNEQSINWLTGIKNLRGCGMSVASIKKYIDLCLEGDSTVPKRYEILLEQKRVIDDELEKLTSYSDYIIKKIERYISIMKDEVTDTTNPDKWMS